MRHLKQFFYGIFYLLLLSALGSGTYYIFFKPAPTCFDNIRNQNEEGIDCGGRCSKMCLPELKPIFPAEVKMVMLPSASSSSPRGTFVAELRNSNPEWAVKDFLYTLRAYDASGRTVASSSGSSFIYAGEVRYLVAANMPVDGNAVRADIKIENPQWRRSSEFGRPEVRIVLAETNIDQVVSARGTIANEGALPVNSELAAIFYDASGNMIGASVGSLERMLPGETREFAIFHPILDNLAPEATRVLNYSYQVK